MADVSTLFVNGSTYNIKDSTARAAAEENATRLSGIRVWTGKCESGASASDIVITLDNTADFTPSVGDVVIARFTNGNSIGSYYANIGGSGSKAVYAYNGVTTTNNSNLKNIGANEVAIFVYSGTYWFLLPTSYGYTTTLAKLASPTFTGTPKAPTAAAGTNTTQIATTAFVQTAVQAAAGGAVAFQGVINSNTAISGLSSYTAGWYWVVGTAGTYVGQTCEVGDMIFCKTSRGSAYSASDFNVVQVNVTGLGALAYKDSATGTVTPASKSITQLSSAGTMTSISSAYENEILSISWTNGTAPQGAAVSVADTQAVNVTVS